MAHTILSNKKSKSATIHFVSTNSTLVISGNSAVSNVALTDEILTGGYIKSAYWGSDLAGSIQVLRGSNLVAVYSSAGDHDYSGFPLTNYSSANLTVNFLGSANSFLMLEVQKVI